MSATMPTPIAASSDMTVIDHIRLGALDVWHSLGHGHSEAVYQRALSVYLNEAGVKHVTEQTIPITYRGRFVGSCRADIVCDDCVLELKVAPALKDIHNEQLSRYMGLLNTTVGALVNFPTTKTQGMFFGPEVRVFDLCDELGRVPSAAN